MRVAVVGLGKIGLPLAVQFATRGVAVVGCDIDIGVVDTVGRGKAPFPGEPSLDEKLMTVVAEGLLTTTSDTTAGVAAADTVIVVVPLVVDAEGTPTFDGIDAATHDIGRGLRTGHLVVYETTLPIGTTRNRFGPILAEISGLTPGADFHLGFSPERVSSGQVFEDLRTYPKLVGGIDDDSTKVAVAFYERVLEFEERPDLLRSNGVWDLGSTESAEMAKLAETIYRDVNIALANEFAEFAEDTGLDIDAIIDASNSQPFSHIHNPGLVGGHCIPVYPHFYLAGHPTALLPAAGRTVNEAVARRIVDRIENAIGSLSEKIVAVLGASYRGGVKETAFSGVFGLVNEINDRGGEPRVHDPLYTDAELEGLGLVPHHLGDVCAAAVVQADHEPYRELTADQLPGCGILFDIRGVVPNNLEAEMTLIRLGRGNEQESLA